MLLSLRNWELNAPWTGSPIKVPAKFIVGDLDTAFYTLGINKYVNSTTFKKDVPLLEEVVIMKGVGHWIQEEKADEICKHIDEFLKKFSKPLVLKSPALMQRMLWFVVVLLLGISFAYVTRV